MPKKYWWEEGGSQTSKQTNTQSNTKKEKKYWWEDDTNQESTQGNSSGHWWDDNNYASMVGDDITNKVNAWLNKHNSYLSEYQKRYEGRKYSYEDAYVGDSAEWLASVGKKKSEFDAEADSIISYIDQNKGYLNQDWIDQVKYAITSARGTQNQLIASAKKDNDYWNSFGSDADLLEKYGSAQGVYEYYQRSDGYNNKYEGLSSDDLKWASEFLEDGEEKEWLNSYQSSVYHDEMLKYDTATAEQKLKTMEQALSSYGAAARYYDMYQANPEAYSGSEYDFIRHWVDVYEGYKQKFGSQEELEDKIQKTKQDINYAKNAQETQRESEKWNSYTKDANFNAYAQKGAAIENPTYHEASGWLQIGNWRAGADEINNIVTFSRDNYNEMMSVNADGGMPVGNPLYIQMTQDEVDLHNAILASEGKETADAYLAFLKPQLQAREGKKTADMITGIDIPVLEDLAVLGYGFGAGVDQWISGTKQFFTGEELDPSSTQYANQYIAESLDGKFGQYAHQAATTIGNMAPSILVSSVLGGAGVASAVAQGAGAATMAVSAAGGAYSDALSKGYDKASARTYSTLVGASEGVLQYLLGGISSLGGMSGKIATKVAAIDSGLLRAAAKLGLNIGSEILEEELQNYLEPAFRSIIFGEDYDAPTIEELVETAIITALSTGALEGGSTISETRVEQNLKKQYDGKTGGIIKEGLENGVDLAKQYKAKIDSGKNLTGAEIRQLLSANQEAVTPKDMEKIQKAAEAKLTELGQTENVSELAKIATKWATGQQLTRAEKKLITNSEYGSQVADQMLPKNIKAGDWAAEIGTRYVNAEAYNKTLIEKVKTAWDEIVKGNDSSTYKSLEERVGEEENFAVSESGKATIRESDVEIDLSKPKVVDFVQDSESGKVTDMVLDVNGEQVKASEIDYADDSQSYLYSAVSKIENITPEDATVIIRDYDPASGLTVSEYLNGMDEAFTYGYHNYSEADLKAGNFAPKLSDTLSNSAYVLGQNARSKSDVDSDAPVVKMRTAAEAKLTAEQKTAQQKARFASKDVEVYFMDGKTVTKFDEHTGKYDDKRMAGVNTAKFLSKLGIGGKYYFYESYVNAEGDRVYKDAYGNEVDAPNGYYKDSDGSIYIDLNAGDYGQGTTLYTLGHELLHFVKDQSKKQFKTLCDLVEEAYSKTDMSMHERVLAKQKFLSDKRGKAVAYTEAYEEVVADAMSTMLSDGTFHEKLMEIKVKDKGLFNTIKRFFQKMIAKFNKAYEELTPDQKDAQDIRAMKDMFDKIQTAFAESLVEASENFQAAQNSAEAIENSDGTVYSKRGYQKVFFKENVFPPFNESQSEAHELAERWSRSESTEVGERKLISFHQKWYLIESFEDMKYGYQIMRQLTKQDYIREASFYETITGYQSLQNTSSENAALLRKVDDTARRGYSSDSDASQHRGADNSLYGMGAAQNAGGYTKSNGTGDLSSSSLDSQGENRSTVKTSESIEAMDVEVDTKTESAAPTVMKSERTWTSSDYVQERDKAAKEIAKAIGVTEQKAKDYIDSINSIAKMIAEDRSRLDYFSSPGRTSFVGNVEYGGSFDFSTLCKKRRLLTGTFTAIQKALPNTALTADEILDIRNRMKEANLEVSCGLCYVEGSRANMGQFAKEFLRLYKQYYPDAWQPNMADVNTPDGIEWVRINHPECYEQYEYFWNHYGTLKEGDKNLFASQQKPKLYQLHTEYKSEILDKFKDDDNVEEKNLNGGIRLQSFSDFEIVHLIDTMQIIMDMSRVGLAGQAYTKVPDFAWALGDTGLKINLSLIAKGVDENGKLIFDDVEGMPIAEAMKLRDRYSKNVGTILVAFNDEQLLAAMADDRVDFIIPFHRSQWKKSQYEAMGLPAKTKDYTFMQNEKYIKPQFHEYRGRMVKDKATNYMPNEYWDFSKSGKENAEAYLEMCARNNKRPKFYKLLQNNGDGSYSLKADGSTDGYWKLLIDFKMYDNEGNGSPQMPVKPEFNMEEANRMLNDYKGGHSNFPVAQGIVDGFVKDYKASHKGQKFSERGTKHDAEYLDAVNRGDMEAAQKMVEEAAKNSGYTVKVYHGTNQMGFTVFDPKKSDDKISLFFTDSQTVAKTYASHHAKVKPTSSFPEIKSFKYERGKKYTEAEMREAFDLIQSVSYIYGIPKFNVENQTMYHAGTRYSAKQLMELADYYSRMGLYEVFVNPDGMMEVDAENHNWNTIADPNVSEYRYKINYKGDNFNYFKANADDAFTLSLLKDGEVEYDGDITFHEMHSMLRKRLGEMRTEMAIRHATDGSGMGSNYHDHAYSDANGNYAKKFVTTRDLAKQAKKQGYKGLIIKNVYDNGGKATGPGYAKYDVPSNLYILFDSNQVKSADPVTYDDAGNVIPLSERFNTKKDDIRYSERNNAPTFYSQMGKVVEGMKQEKFGASSVISMLRGRGVKAEEIRWSGIQAFLDGKKSVTKAELLEFIQGSMLHVEEETRGGEALNEFATEWLSLVNNDSSVVENLVVDDEFLADAEQFLQEWVYDGDMEQDEMDRLMELARKAKGEGKPSKWDNYKLDGGKNYRELVFKMPGATHTNDAMQVHWGKDSKGVLAHARMQDFDVDGKKMLFIEEIQSDWHNEGHTKGYVDESKRLTVDNTEMRHENRGYSLYHNGNDLHQWVSEAFLKQRFTNGITEEEIHKGLVDEYNHVAVERNNGVDLVPDAPFKDNYHEFVLKRLLRMAAEEGYDSIGWTPADIQSNRWSEDYAEGYRIEYDQDIPKFLKKYGKQWGAEVGKTSLGNKSDKQTYIDDSGKSYKSIREWYDSVMDSYATKDMSVWKAYIAGKTKVIQVGDKMHIQMKDEGNILDESLTISTTPDTVWSMDITPAMKKSVLEEGQVLYSERGDGTSNRSLLANAFEGITKDSIEYKMIQDYKGHINVLNMLDKRLSVLNGEIRDIRFTEGKYDAEKLQKLESERKDVIKEINRYDKMLLNLEASEPLRKVIVRERQKEAQKTKAHVKEIQQNKKVRAEQTELRHKIRKTVRDLDKILNRGNKKQNVKEDMKGFVSKALDLADYLFTDHISNDELIRRGIDADLMRGNEAQLVKETEEILSKLYDHADSLTDEEFTRLDAKRKANEAKLKDLLTAQRNKVQETPVYKLFNDLVTEYASLKNSSQDAVKAAYSEDVERLLRSFLGDADSERTKALQNMRVADMTTEELWKLYNAYTVVLTTVRDANKFFAKGMTETIEQVVGQIASDFGSRKIPEKKLAIVAQKLSNKIGWDYEKLYYALDRIGSDSFTKLIMNLADSENTVMQDVIEAVNFRDEIVEKYGFNNWAVNKEIDREFMDNSGKKFKMTLGQMMSLYAYSRREGAWDHIEYGGFVFGEAALTNPKPADSYKLSKAQCEAITSLLTKEQKGYVEEMQKYLSETMGAKGNEVSMQLYGIKMFGEKNYFPIHIAGQFKAQANESQAKAAAGFQSMSNAGFTHAQNPNAKAPFVLEGFNEVWSDHVNEMSRYHGTVPALEDIRRVMNRSTYSDSVAESQSIRQLMENHYGKEAVDYFDSLYREANSGAITDKLQKWPKKLLSLFRKNSVAYSLSVVIQQPSAMARAYAMVDKKYFGFKGFGALTSGVAKAVTSKWNPAYANAYNEMLKYAPGVTMAKEIGGFDTHTGTSIREHLLDTNKSFKQKMKTENALGKGKALLDVVDNNAIANLPNVADKIAWIEIWNACKRETAAKHKDLATNSNEFMQIVGERFTEVIRATQVYDSIFAKSPMLKSKNLAVQYLVSFMNEPNTTVNMVEKAVRDATNGNWKGGLRIAGAVTYSIIFNNVLKAIVYAMRDDDEDETYIEKYISAIAGGIMDDFNPINYIPIAKDVWSKFRGYDVERPDMAIITDAIDAFQAIAKLNGKDTEDMTDEEIAELEKKIAEANWKLVGSLAAFFGIPVKNIYREIEGVIDHARIASANAGMTTASSLWDKVKEEVIDSIPFMSTNESKQDKLYNAIVSGDQAYVDRIKATYKTESAYQSAVRKALRENDPRIRQAAQERYDGNTEEYKRIFREIRDEGIFSWDEIMDAVNSEENAIKNKLEPEKATSNYSASDFVQAVSMGNTSSAKAIRDDIIATHIDNDKTQKEAEEAFASSVKTSINDAYSSGLLDDTGAKNMLIEYAGMDEEDATSRVSYWAFCDENPKYANDVSEAKYNKYKEFAEPAGISVDVYAQFLNGTKGLSNIKDEWGNAVQTEQDQVIEIIDSLPLTKQQKDALFLAYGYKESSLWKVNW